MVFLDGLQLAYLCLAQVRRWLQCLGDWLVDRSGSVLDRAPASLDKLTVDPTDKAAEIKVGREQRNDNQGDRRQGGGEQTKAEQRVRGTTEGRPGADGKDSAARRQNRRFIEV